MAAEAETTEPARSRPDPKLVKHVARAISGLSRPAWVSLGKEEKNPHIVTARRALRAVDRYQKSADEDGDDQSSAEEA